MLKEQIRQAESDAEGAFKAAKNAKDLYDLKVKHLGKQGAFSLLMREFGKLPPAEKPAMGQLINESKTRLEELYARLENDLKRAEINASIEKERIDLTLPGPRPFEGG